MLHGPTRAGIWKAWTILGSVGSRIRLIRWLGPWANQEQSPPNSAVKRRLSRETGDPFDGVMFTPTGTISGSYLIAPGVHYNGPFDPRMERFARVLAHAGILTVIPALTDYLVLKIWPSVIAEFETALDYLLQLETTTTRPGLLSISFGSLPALCVASRRSQDIGTLITFGGYADFRDTVRFCMTGMIGDEKYGLHDPLNSPVGFVNFVDAMDVAPPDTSLLKRAWLEYCKRTWGQQAMKDDVELRDAVAREISKTLPEDQRHLYLQGCRAEPGGWELCEVALTRLTAEADTLDPRARMGEIECRVHLVHGADDDVIPHTQLKALTEALVHSNVHTHMTGMFGHAGTSGLATLLRRLPSAFHEITTMLQIVGALATPYRR